MRLTSYRAAPPRVGWVGGLLAAGGVVPPELRWGGSAGPGGDLLFHALRRSTIGAEGFHGRVRDGIGCFAPRYGHQAGQDRRFSKTAGFALHYPALPAQHFGRRLSRKIGGTLVGRLPAAGCRDR